MISQGRSADGRTKWFEEISWCRPSGVSEAWLGGDLLRKLGRHEEAREEFERAAALTRNARERGLLLERAAASARGLRVGRGVRPDGRVDGRGARSSREWNGGGSARWGAG